MTYYTPPQPQVKTIKFDVEKFMSKFTLIRGTTLFEPTRQDITKALLEKRCPLCFCRLYPNRAKTLWFCKSVRRDKFVVKSETLAKYF